jgi:hypothetical protein
VTRSSAAAAWYGRLGFTKEWEHRFEPGLPAFVSVARGPMRLFLSEHQGDARPDALIYLRMADVDAIAAEFGVAVEEAPWPAARAARSRRQPAADRHPDQLSRQAGVDQAVLGRHRRWQAR